MTALYGAGAGAVLVAVLGFTLGGWTTASSAQKSADEATSSAVLAIMTPWCVAQAGEAEAAAVLTEIRNERNFTAQRRMIESAGWATPIGSKEPVPSVADACLRTISAGF